MSDAAGPHPTRRKCNHPSICVVIVIIASSVFCQSIPALPVLTRMNHSWHGWQTSRRIVWLFATETSWTNHRSAAMLQSISIVVGVPVPPAATAHPSTLRARGGRALRLWHSRQPRAPPGEGRATPPHGARAHRCRYVRADGIEVPPPACAGGSLEEEESGLVTHGVATSASDRSPLVTSRGPTREELPPLFFSVTLPTRGCTEGRADSDGHASWTRGHDTTAIVPWCRVPWSTACGPCSTRSGARSPRSVLRRPMEPRDASKGAGWDTSP